VDLGEDGNLPLGRSVKRLAGLDVRLPVRVRALRRAYEIDELIGHFDQEASWIAPRCERR
jgi:hypothetical protein